MKDRFAKYTGWIVALLILTIAAAPPFVVSHRNALNLDTDLHLTFTGSQPAGRLTLVDYSNAENYLWHIRMTNVLIAAVSDTNYDPAQLIVAHSGGNGVRGDDTGIAPVYGQFPDSKAFPTNLSSYNHF